MVFDSEAVFYAVGQFLRHRRVEPLYTPAGLHNRLVERLIQEVKAKVRTIEAGMLFIPPASLKAETILAAIDTIAVSPNSKSGPHTCPFTMVSGLLPALRPHAYGQVGLCYSKRLDQPDLRSEWCIYLGLESNSPGHHRVFMPQRGIIYSRRKFDPQSGYPGQWNYPPRVTTQSSSILKLSDQEIESALDDAFGTDQQQHQQRINSVINAPVEPLVGLQGVAPVAARAEGVGATVGPLDAVEYSSAVAVHQASADDVAVAREEPPAMAQGASPLRRSSRVSAPAYAPAKAHNVASFAARLEQAREVRNEEDRRMSIVANRMSLKRALKQADLVRRNGAMQSAEKEISQLVTTTAILPVKRSSLSPNC
jgi:hypothetical protein